MFGWLLRKRTDDGYSVVQRRKGEDGLSYTANTPAKQKARDVVQPGDSAPVKEILHPERKMHEKAAAVNIKGQTFTRPAKKDHEMAVKIKRKTELR